MKGAMEQDVVIISEKKKPARNAHFFEYGYTPVSCHR